MVVSSVRVQAECKNGFSGVKPAKSNASGVLLRVKNTGVNVCYASITSVQDVLSIMLCVLQTDIVIDHTQAKWCETDTLCMFLITENMTWGEWKVLEWTSRCPCMQK
jgi:hypothetical protein